MPEYTYRCENCGIEFDIHQDFKDAPLTVCPECAEEALHKVYKPARIIFKGKGFYATDHKPSSRKSYLNEVPDSSGDSSDSESKAEKKDSPKAETKTESKPAAKSDD